jgi:hypothetical protein
VAADQRKVKLNSGNSLNTFLKSVMDEGVKSALAHRALTEKEKQNSMGGSGDGGDQNDSSDDDDLFGTGGGDDKGGDEESTTSSKTMDDESEKLQQGEIKVKDVVDKLNSIRGGKSFKDDQVAQAMDEYVNSLAKAEKVALLSFLKGIAQIVTGEVPGDQAEEPSDDPADVKMEKGTKKDVRHVKPNVIKGAGGSNMPSKKHEPSQEDTSAPISAPITPKRR